MYIVLCTAHLYWGKETRIPILWIWNFVAFEIQSFLTWNACIVMKRIPQQFLFEDDIYIYYIIYILYIYYIIYILYIYIYYYIHIIYISYSHRSRVTSLLIDDTTKTHQNRTFGSTVQGIEYWILLSRCSCFSKNPSPSRFHFIQPWLEKWSLKVKDHFWE